MLLKSFFTILFLLVTSNNLSAENIDYSVWLDDFKIKAEKSGISKETIDIDSVLGLLRHKSQLFCYLCIKKPLIIY